MNLSQGPWVVYAVDGNPNLRAVCRQNEWTRLTAAAKPGFYNLIHGGILNEGEAERLARGTAGDQYRQLDRRPRPPLPVPAPVAVPATPTPWWVP
jgi:hypothetical protein